MNPTIIIDLEWNCYSGVSEIIQIAAERIDTGTYTVADRFCEYVRPSLPITRRISLLTGITQRQVDNADPFDVVILRFFDWCSSKGTSYQLLSWDDSDIRMIEEESLAKGVTDLPDLRSRYRDFQKEFSEALHMERKFKLTDAVTLAGLDFDGKQHDACWDVHNTAALFIAFQTRNSVFSRLVAALNESRKPLSASLGAMLGNFTFS